MPSPGCARCYSHRLNGRFGTGLPYNKRSEDEIELFLDLKGMEALHRRRKPSKVFLCDMTDLFGEFVPFEWIDRIFELIAVSTQHTFQILTKRPGRMVEYFRGGRPTLGNVWLGTSVEDQQRADERIPALLEIPTAVRFLSIEPLLGPIELRKGIYMMPDPIKPTPTWRGTTLERSFGGGIDWVIVGGESGPGARPCDLAWIRSIVGQCRSAGVPVFVKQLGAMPVADFDDASVNFRDPKGGDPDEWPEDLRVREFPR